MVVAVALGRPGIDALLVASQVALAVVLPFVTFPLIWLTSSKEIMSVRKTGTVDNDDPERDCSEMIDFSCGKVLTTVGWAIWLIMVAANVYVIVTLAMGTGD